MIRSQRARHVYLLALLSLGLVSLPADRTSSFPPPACCSKIMAEEEDLVYEVSWTFFKLGSIRLKTFRDYTAEAHVHSYEGVPFVDLHSIHYTTMDSSFYSRGSRSIEKKENVWTGMNYVYDLPNHRLTVEATLQKDPQSQPDSRSAKDTIHLDTINFIDGLSIAYLPRAFVHSERSIDVPTVLYGKLGTTTFNFSGKKVTEELDALDKPVKAVELTGTTSAEGIYGMTGDFRGWFSDDSAAVPLKGKLKVLIGNVNVELIKWNRKGWNPPQ
jgi:hypothetical protein